MLHKASTAGAKISIIAFKIPSIQAFKNALPFADETIQCKKYINSTGVYCFGNTIRWTGEYNTCNKKNYTHHGLVELE
jgi:hypothetical protein